MIGVGDAIGGLVQWAMLGLLMVGVTAFIGLWRSPLLRGRRLAIRSVAVLAGTVAIMALFILLLRLRLRGLLWPAPWACGALLLYFAVTSRSLKALLRDLF